MNAKIVLVFMIHFKSVFGSVIRDWKQGSREFGEGSSFPYQVMLLASMSNGRFLCGGTLLDNEWILTAAHCVEGVSSFEVHLGADSFEDADEPGRIIQKTNKYILHEKYNPTFAHNDIALVKLPQKVKFTDKIQPAKLPGVKDTFEGRSVIASGWGSARPKTTAEKLQQTEFEVISNKECLRSFSKLIIQDAVLCAKGVSVENVCTGDSGGPLVLKDTRTVVGVTSFGNVNGCSQRSPGGFSRISSHLDWIRSKTGIKG